MLFTKLGNNQLNILTKEHLEVLMRYGQYVKLVNEQSDISFAISLPK